MKMIHENVRTFMADRFLVLACLFAVLGLAGCQQEGSAEKAGKKIDQAVENTERKIESAKESLDRKADRAGEYVDDAVITAKLKAAILNDALLNGSHIEVNTVDGVVKLSGTVDSEQSIVRASELANSQSNVKSVHTGLIIKTIQPSKKQ